MKKGGTCLIGSFEEELQNTCTAIQSLNDWEHCTMKLFKQFQKQQLHIDFGEILSVSSNEESTTQ